MTAHPSPAHEAAGDEKLLVHNWRVTRLTRLGVPGPLITGDHAVTAAAIAGQLGIDGAVLTGAEFGAMSDEEALARMDDVGLVLGSAPSTRPGWSTCSGGKARSWR